MTHQQDKRFSPNLQLPPYLILLVIMLVIIVGGLWYYREQKEALMRESGGKLTAIARLKANQISAWRADQLAEGKEWMSSIFFIQELKRWLADPSPETTEQIRLQLHSIQARYNYVDILIVDRDGKMLFSLRGHMQMLQDEVQLFLNKALDERKPVLTDLHKCNIDQNPHISVITPIYLENQFTEPIGVIIMISDAREFLYPLIQSWPIPSKTGETLLVRREGDEVLFLNDLRHQPDTALKLRIPLSQIDLPEIKAVLGEKGLVEGKDYRGVEVLAVLLPIKDSSWFIVAKEDMEEILEELGVRSRLIFSITLSLLLLSMAGGLIIVQRRRKEQYKALYRAEAKLRESEARFKLAAENTIDVFWDWDIESGKLEWFGKMDELLGYAAGEFPRTIKAWEESIHPDDQRRVMATLEQHLKTGAVYVAEYRIRRKDGTYAYWIDKGSVIRSPEGIPVRMIGVCTDITERKQAEEKLRKNQAKLELLNRVAQVTIESRSPYEMADRLLEIVRGIMPCDAFYIDAFDETTNEVRGVKTYDTIDGVLRPVPTQVIKPDTSGEFYQTVILKKQTLRIFRKPEALSSTTMIPFGDVTRLSASLLFAPLIARNKVLGVISVQSYTPDAYTEEDEALISDIARQAGPAFEAIQLYQQTLQAKEALSLSKERLEQIAQITGAVVGARSKEELAQILTSQICEFFSVDACIIRELIGNELVLVGAAGIPLECQIQEMEIRGLGKEILTTRKPLVVPDVYTHPLTREYAEPKPGVFQFLSYAGVPMIVQDEVVGILGVYTTTQRREFTPTEITHLQIVANDAGIALINERLFAELKRQRDRLEQEIAERQRAEESLRTNEVRYRTLFESTLNAIMILEISSCRFSMVNPATVAIFGAQTEEDLIDKTPWELSPDFQPDGRESEEKAREMIEIALQRRSHFFEWRHKRLDGKEFPATVQLIRVELEGRVYLQATVCDITETKRLQAQFLQAQKMEAVGRLAGGIAHDFNNLLTGLVGYAEMALMSLSTSDPIYKEIVNIKNTALRASELIRQLLAFSRRQVAEPCVINLNQRIREMENLLRRIIGEDIKLITLLAEDLAPVKIDPAQVEQIIMNLAVNARDAMLKGGLLTIETQNVSLDQEYVQTHPEVSPGEYVMLAVSDTGCGMSEEVKAHLFEPFFTTKDRSKGTGLGLSTVYGIVKQNNGFIYVYSELGKGTTFKIYLPQVQAEITPEVKPEAIGKSLWGTETILLVEDEESVREVATRALRQNGYEVLLASSGSEALEMLDDELKGKDIHLLLTDVVLPAMSGKELALYLQEIYPQLKVLFMSGYANGLITNHFVVEPGINFLPKPFTPLDLLRKVREVLDKK